MRRSLALPVIVAALLALLALPGVASADVPSVLGGDTVSGTAISCTTQSDGVRVCQGDISSGPVGADTRLKSFDGTPLALYVILPPAPSTGPDRGYPLMIQSHGYGSKAKGPDNPEYLGPTGDQWARDGYAVLQLTARGFGNSCGSMASRLSDPGPCAGGYIRLDDNRYEVRDIQYATGLLVDAGLVDPARIGATGESYGGGVSLQLASLRNRVMLGDGSLQPWTSRKGTPLSLAAAAPVIPWSDLVGSLLPNGRTLDTQIASPTTDLSPLGIEKQSYVSGLFASGQASGYYAPPGTNPEADLTTWFSSLNAGEPYDSNPEDQSIASTIARYHSAYYLLDGAYGVPAQAPAPLLIANGFTDDLFPVDEAVRYANLERSLYPDAPVGLYAFDFGHSRGQNKAADLAGLVTRIQAFFDHYVKGTAPAPPLGATALTQTCPASAPSAGPYSAPDWAGLHPGVVPFASAAAQTIVSGTGSAAISSAIDPIAGQGACATVSAADQGAGVASYRLPAATGNGYTLLGAPVITASLAPTGSYPVIAGRLWDVDPTAGTETLVARGLYRVTAGGNQTFQLHPGAWHFAAGHIPKLELLSQDAPYARTSNGQFSIDVSKLSLTLPVHEVPGAPGTPPAVRTPGPVATAACTARPSSRITRHRIDRRRRLILSGRATERPCAHASAQVHRSQRIRSVLVSISRAAGRGRCRFVTAAGRLSRPRSCRRALPLRARGTSRWSLTRRLRVPEGRYLVRVLAFDARGARQRVSTNTHIRVR